ncbi:MBL fold metallo-hydrolase [Lactonifactor longoviformis]|uniref:MBL fold metallo-hydrolase n=1 Tax=Lactonifactor longoviformis TaxID=341220 RepID=UPI001D02FA6B|nr:MBL fold metallo-hydrolase [Lactonifactor longoviformis]MCB5711906.1 MBL fold metallo-hydrolase [Lactonifactor longoviformis]MCB5715873.1 MBL fold metallo-hydrolase [Lactonifactor longoviformis]
MAKIVTLIEDTGRDDGLEKEHGLSFYIEAAGHKILFDTGAGNRFLTNAEALDIDISQADTLVISHGHYDHGGGMEAFLEINQKAGIYIRMDAFLPHYSLKQEGWTDIGICSKLKNSPRMRFTEQEFQIDEGLFLFSNVKGRVLWPDSNQNLKVKIGDRYVQDDFAHEQNLVISEDGRKILVAGCAHNGIINVLEHYRQLKNEMPDLVVGGLHLTNPRAGTSIEPEIVREIGDRLSAYPCSYMVCHCTGEEAYGILRRKLGDRIQYIRTGDVIH